MRKYLIYFISCLALCGLAGCRDNQEAVPALLDPVDVKMDEAAAEYGEIYKANVLEGKIVPHVEELSFSVDGQLETINVSLGDCVKKGQVLAVLDVEDAGEQAKQLEREVEALQIRGEFEDRQLLADIQIAQLELKSLHEAGAIEETRRLKEIEIQQLQTQLSQNQELRELEISEKKRCLAQYERETENNTLTAPFDGQVVFITAASDTAAVESYSPLIYLADESRLYLKTDYLSQQTFQIADRVLARIDDREYEVSYVPYDREEFMSMIISGENLWTQFTLEGDTSGITCGQYGALVVYSTYKEHVLTVPANAIYRDGSQSYVYRIEDGRKIRSDVTVGLTNDAKAEITEGLTEGDRVYVRE